MATMTNPARTQGVYVNVPLVDLSLFNELIRKFGWKAETREQLLERFVNSRSDSESGLFGRRTEA